VAYQRERARGGVALLITGATPVHESSLVHSRDFLRNVDDRIIPGYRRFADAVHAEGARAFAQLAHFGALADPQLNERAAWAPSPVAAELYRQIPHEMTEDEIAEVIEAFARAAARAREGGLDGVELLFAFGLLVAAFMSPYANHRTDRWGGSLENRLRFPLAVIDAVRARGRP
jgi:2,4-dienoyl-CoA reductase-like NADH-dependent reductase (Old Yellow Enzyme family)